MSEFKQHLRNARIEQIKAQVNQQRVIAEINGHLLPRLNNLLTLENTILIKEQILLVMAAVEDICELTKGECHENN